MHFRYVANIVAAITLFTFQSHEALSADPDVSTPRSKAKIKADQPWHLSGKSANIPARTTTPVSRKRAAVMQAAGDEAVSVQSVRRSHGSQVVVGAKSIQEEVPGVSVLKVLAKMPGIMLQTADAQGLDIWSQMFFMHGFLQNQVGMTLDGIPLGDQQYHSFNGLNVINAWSSENMGRMVVSEGAGAESIASTSNLGGSVEYFSSDPKHKAGGQLGQTFGSNLTMHTFIRLDSGDLNKTGTRMYVSYMRNDENKWKGGGNQFMQQANAKLVQPIGHDSQISALFDWGDLEQYQYQDLSFDMLHNGGSRLDNFIGTPDGYAKAYRLALAANDKPGGALPAGYSKMSDPYDASYYDGGTVERDYLGGLNMDFALTSRLRWKSVIYGQGQYGRGFWTSPYPWYSNGLMPNGSPLFEQITIEKAQRGGFTSALSYEIAHNSISAGIWYEHYHVDVGRNAYEEPVLGEGTPINAMGSLPDATARLWGQSFNSNSFTAFVQDTWHVLPNLNLHFGFKSLWQTVSGSETANIAAYTGTDAIASGSVTTAKAFLPHISGDWHFLKNHELFFDVAENVKSYPISGYKGGASPFAMTESAYQQTVGEGKLKPETDWNYSVGYRYTDHLLAASLYAYHTNFHNRLQQITSGSITNPYSAVMNVGGVTMNGVDAGLTITPVKGLSLYNSISWNHATYDNNVTSDGTTYATAGKQIVNYPRFMYKASLSYTWHHASAHIDTQYMGQRSYTYTGDLHVPSYWLTSLGAMYRFGNLAQYDRRLGFFQDVTFSFNVYNLTNIKYISTTGENGNSMQGDDQSFLIGAPRQYFGSMSVSF
ncbi:TonB-dependent receptor [Acetobacter oeni]|uniref:TonB-dependent receptor n=1 Tax=Acetobacter oeni TaxID=304077 RepID=A0A511XKC3_9PROT|nr:TonB-dependent receptor [Acetobacter oeni]MBB3883879.1 iron complex outermembrane receptor protein [Acetobacter oeni]GEN63368.1 TonB-dependent receptor [Acetobacter oeni]